MYKLFGKRVFDIFFSVLLFLVVSPVFLLICMLLFFYNGTQIFFLQIRPGKNEKLFSIIKFKTMKDVYPGKNTFATDAQRITSPGRWLRNTHLDELPQLLNVLKGDMSLIGPRPLLAEYLPLYNSKQKKRHLVKPGITGWAQVHQARSWNDVFLLDNWYVEHVSLKTDLKIFFLSIKKIVAEIFTKQTEKILGEKFTGFN